MRPIILSGALLIALGGIGCMGIDIANGDIALTRGFRANTNPAQEYHSAAATIGKGGLMFHMNTVPQQVGLNAESTRTGEACVYGFFWLVAWGDQSIEAAKKNGEIQKVSSVEQRIMAALGAVFQMNCTVVKGS